MKLELPEARSERVMITSLYLRFMDWSLTIPLKEKILIPDGPEKILSPLGWFVSWIDSYNDNGSAEVAVMPGISVAGALAGALEAERNETAKENEIGIPFEENEVETQDGETKPVNFPQCDFRAVFGE
jgi:hypothetical protein